MDSTLDVARCGSGGGGGGGGGSASTHPFPFCILSSERLRLHVRAGREHHVEARDPTGACVRWPTAAFEDSLLQLTALQQIGASNHVVNRFAVAISSLRQLSGDEAVTAAIYIEENWLRQCSTYSSF